METVPLVGTPFSRLRMSMMFWRTCGRPARRRKKNLQTVVTVEIQIQISQIQIPADRGGERNVHASKMGQQ